MRELSRFNSSFVIRRYAKVPVADEGQRFAGDGALQGQHDQRSHYRHIRLPHAQDYE